MDACCGRHSSLQLAPKYEVLGNKFRAAGDSNVVIAKMDATENDITMAGLAVDGYPTLYFFPAGEGAAPVLVETDLTTAALHKWVQQNRYAKRIAREYLSTRVCL